MNIKPVNNNYYKKQNFGLNCKELAQMAYRSANSLDASSYQALLRGKPIEELENMFKKIHRESKERVASFVDDQEAYAKAASDRNKQFWEGLPEIEKKLIQSGIVSSSELLNIKKAIKIEGPASPLGVIGARKSYKYAEPSNKLEAYIVLYTEAEKLKKRALESDLYEMQTVKTASRFSLNA